MEGKAPLVKTKNKEGVTALREIAEGLVVADQDSGNTRQHHSSSPEDLLT
jgi:DNA-directed RNA polymerase subunit K/omega